MCSSRGQDLMTTWQLLSCSNVPKKLLVISFLKLDPEITSKAVDTVLTQMKSLAVIPVAIGVLRAELLELMQKRDKPFRTFYSRVRGKAETCEFFANSGCMCGQSNRIN